MHDDTTRTTIREALAAGLDVDELARAAGVGRETVLRAGAGGKVRTLSMTRLDAWAERRRGGKP